MSIKKKFLISWVSELLITGTTSNILNDKSDIFCLHFIL